jgi:hypothetical protein
MALAPMIFWLAGIAISRALLEASQILPLESKDWLTQRRAGRAKAVSDPYLKLVTLRVVNDLFWAHTLRYLALGGHKALFRTLLTHSEDRLARLFSGMTPMGTLRTACATYRGPTTADRLY